MINITDNLKHAAAAAFNPFTGAVDFWALEATTPTGTYHWAHAKNDKPPILRKITRLELTDFNTGNFKYLREVTIGKRGWHYIKGARKTARTRKTA